MGYFDSVSANLKAGVGAQVKGIADGVKANSAARLSPSVNAIDTGVKATTALGGLADGLCEAAMLEGLYAACICLVNPYVTAYPPPMTCKLKKEVSIEKILRFWAFSCEKTVRISALIC